jgi:uncharacterized protein (DUF433 family)
MLELETVKTVPLTRWADGSIRVAGSRVTLDVVVHNYKQGATAEQIQEDFPTLALRDVYGVLAYYLGHAEAVEDYLRERRQGAAEIRRTLESEFPSALRESIRACSRHQAAAYSV